MEGFDGECSAPLVKDQYGNVLGVYIDDTTPDIDQWVEKAVRKYGPQGKHVFVAIAPNRVGQRHHPIPVVVNWLEVYWKGSGLSVRAYWRQLLRQKNHRYDGYIVQWNFGMFTGKGPPRWQSKAMIKLLKTHKPKYMMLF